MQTVETIMPLTSRTGHESSQTKVATGCTRRLVYGEAENRQLQRPAALSCTSVSRQAGLGALSGVEPPFPSGCGHLMLINVPGITRVKKARVPQKYLCFRQGL